jgi:two-component system, chemotaxis family, chemotaxis protein CheY
MANVNCADLSVLVVDDHALMRDVLQQHLVKMGFGTVDLAGSAVQAEEKLAAKPYDIVFLDWVMPGKSGFMLMQEHRQNRAFDHVAFVMVTNQAEERHMVEALKAGATSYIIKPPMIASLQTKVAAVLDWIEKVSPRFKQTS